MKRIISVLTVMAIMAALMVATAVPAFADADGVPNGNACHGQEVAKGLEERPGQFQKSTGIPVQVQQEYGYRACRA